MPSIFFASVRHLLRPLLGLLGMAAPSPALNAEFPTEISVQDWEPTLMQLYCSHDSVSGLSNSRYMESLKVTRIRRYKERSNSEHEYLIAQVSTTHPGELRFIRIERFPDDQAVQSTKTPGEKGPLHTVSAPSSQTSLPLKDLPARDRARAISGWPNSNDDACIENLDCKHASLILLDLVIAAKAVHDYRNMYQLFRHQCFWYSDMIVAILEQEFPQIRLVERSDFIRGIRSEDAEVEVLDKVGGTYKKLPIYLRRISIVKEIHDVFQTQRLDARSAVCLLDCGILLLTYDCYRLQRV